MLKGSWLYTSFCSTDSISRCFTPKRAWFQQQRDYADKSNCSLLAWSLIRGHTSRTGSTRAYRNNNSGMDINLVSSLFKISCTRRYFLFQVHRSPLHIKNARREITPIQLYSNSLKYNWGSWWAVTTKQSPNHPDEAGIAPLREN